MKLLVKNVGKIDNAEIDIEGITTLIGVNETGKSTISKSLYCILNSFCNMSYKILENKIRKVRRKLDMLLQKIVFDENNKNISRYTSRTTRYSRIIAGEIMSQYQQLPIDKKMNRNDIKTIMQNICDFNIQIKELDVYIDNILEEVNKKDIEYIDEIINRQFLIEFNEQINYLDKNTSAEISLTEEEISIYAKFKENRVTGASKLKTVQYNPIYIDTPYILDYYGDYVFFNGEDEAHAAKLLSKFKEKITDNDNIEDLNESTQRLQKVKDILNKIVNGNFNYDESGNITYENKKTKSKLQLANLATGLKTFVIIKKLIENGMINENTVLIIDEPEVHLHPDWQLKLAEILVNLNKELNIKILISTHSPYFLRAIQVYCAKYEVANKEKIYYIKNQSNGLSISEEITGDTTEIFEQLTKPFVELEEEIQS